MQTPQSGADSMHCQHCDKPLRPGARFCPACGKPVQPQGETASGLSAPGQPPAAAAAEVAQPRPAAPQPGAPPRSQTDWKKGILVGCGCLAIVFVFTALAGFVLYQLYQSGDSLMALIYSPTPTATPTATPNYRATEAQATLIAGTATAEARAITQTALASATAGARTATAAYQRTRSAATSAAIKTRAAAIQQAETATQQAIDELNQTLETICDGNGAPEAAAYANRRAFHPILIYPDSYPYPDEARPQSVSQLELVACVVKTSATIRTTAYQQNHTCIEKVHVAKITLRAATTGSVVYSSEVRGSNPARCAYTEFFTGATKTKYGGQVDSTQIWEKVKGYVYLELKSAFIDQPLAGWGPKLRP